MRTYCLFSKKNLVALLILTGFYFCSCDIEEAPYKYIGGLGKISTDLTRTDTVKSGSLQNVLIEDFTGWNCGNCPAASDVAHVLKEQYGERVIPVKIHTTIQFSAPDNIHESRDFRNKVGEEIFNFFKGNSLPNGMINRKMVNTSQIVYHTAWSGLAKSALEQNPSMDIKLHSRVSDNNGKASMNVQVQLNYLKDGSLEDKLVLFYVEDSVKGVQKDYRKDDPLVDPYYHMEMLRGAVTGPWGESVSLFASEKKNEIPKSGQKIAIDYSQDLNPDWNPDHLYLVAFVYNEKSKEVIQVTKRKLK